MLGRRGVLHLLKPQFNQQEKSKNRILNSQQINVNQNQDEIKDEIKKWRNQTNSMTLFPSNLANAPTRTGIF